MGTVALVKKLCPDCGKPMLKDGVGAWKCPDGHGEWLRNEVEVTVVKIKTEVRFGPLTEGLKPMSWYSPDKPILPAGPIIIKGGSKCKTAKKKLNKLLITDRFMLD